MLQARHGQGLGPALQPESGRGPRFQVAQQHQRGRQEPQGQECQDGRQERVKISARFPEEYARWSQNVPAFVPRPTAWRDPMVGEVERFSPALYMRHGEWKAALGFILALTWLVLRMRGDLG
jgi:hypothetical protein